jgi:hypothetical protein
MSCQARAGYAVCDVLRLAGESDSGEELNCLEY